MEACWRLDTRVGKRLALGWNVSWSFAILEGQESREGTGMIVHGLVTSARVTFSGLAVNNERLELADMSGDDDMSIDEQYHRGRLEDRKI